MRVENNYSMTVNTQQAQESGPEREPDGDRDDKSAKSASAKPANQIYKDGMGTKVDIFA